MDAELSAAFGLSDVKNKEAKYKSLVDNCVKKLDDKGLQKIVNFSMAFF